MSQRHSLWTEQAPPFANDFDPAHPGAIPERADVVIIGAGLVGLTSAVLMAELGLSVVVLEADKLGRGVSAQSTVKLSIAQGLKLSSIERARGEEHVREYAQQTLDGFALFLQIVDKYDIECDLERRDHFLYTKDPALADQLRHEVALGEANGYPFQPEPVADPWHVAHCAGMSDQYIFHPVKYLHGLAHAAQNLGAQIYTGAGITGRPSRKRGVEVVGARGRSRLHADFFLVATHVPISSPSFQFARYEQIRDYAISGLIQNDADYWATAPMTLGIDDDEPSMRSWRTPTGTRFVATGQQHRTGSPPTIDPWRELLSWSEQRLGPVNVTHQWSSQDVFPFDKTPLVGAVAPGSDVLMATGFAAWGFTTGTAAANMLTRHVGGDASALSQSWKPTRLPTDATVSTICANSSVALQWLRDHLPRGRSDADTGIDLNEGRVVHCENGPLAVTRNADGEVIAVDARCTHLGCNVSWNKAERTWDCPCHGSRFSADGAVLHGPAMRALQRRDPFEQKSPSE